MTKGEVAHIYLEKGDEGRAVFHAETDKVQVVWIDRVDLVVDQKRLDGMSRHLKYNYILWHFGKKKKKK